MGWRLLTCGLLVAPGWALGFVKQAQATGVGAHRPPIASRAAPSLSWFEVNRGQAPGGAKFILRSGGGVALFSGSSMDAQGWQHDHAGVLHRTTTHLRLPTSLKLIGPLGLTRLDGRVNYFLGQQARQWHLDVPTYAGIIYRSTTEDLDLHVSAEAGGFSYAWSGSAQALHRVLRVSPASLSQRGSQISLTPGTHYFDFSTPSTPVSVPQTIKSRGERRANRKVAVSVPPSLAHTKYLGGKDFDEDKTGGLPASNAANGIASDSAGNIYITGYTDATDFPTLHSFQTRPVLQDAFVTKLNPDGKLVYSSFLGGAGNDLGLAITVDKLREPVVVGQTNSVDFPVRNPLQRKEGGSCDQSTAVTGTFCLDGFVTKVSAKGDSLIYSTYLGGSNNDVANAVAADKNGAAYVTGATESSNFPTLRPLQTESGGQLCISEADTVDNVTVPCDHAFVSKISASGRLEYSTFLGGHHDDAGAGIAVRGGRAYVVGYTASGNFPTKDPIQTSLRGASNGFLSVLDKTGSSLAYSTFLGGTKYDDATAVAVDKKSEVYVAGETASADFPITSGAAQHKKSGTQSDNYDAFVTKIKPGAKSLDYSTYIGGSGDDSPTGIAVDSAGSAYVSGSTQSRDFPNVRPVQTINNQANNLFGTDIDGFLTKVSANGRSFAYSTYIGAAQADMNDAAGVALSGKNNVWVAGATDAGALNPAVSVYLADVLQH